jgi:hypothetical protein
VENIYKFKYNEFPKQNGKLCWRAVTTKKKRELKAISEEKHKENIKLELSLPTTLVGWINLVALKV